MSALPKVRAHRRGHCYRCHKKLPAHLVGEAYCEHLPCEALDRVEVGEAQVLGNKSEAISAENPQVGHWDAVDELNAGYRATSEGRRAREDMHRSMKSGAGAAFAVAAKNKPEGSDF